MAVPSRRKFIVGAAAATPVVMTIASKPAQAYECSHSALSSGRGSGRHTKRRNPKACYNQEIGQINSYYKPRIAAAQQDLQAAQAADPADPAAVQAAHNEISSLTSKMNGEKKTKYNQYAKYPGF